MLVRYAWKLSTLWNHQNRLKNFVVYWKWKEDAQKRNLCLGTHTYTPLALTHSYAHNPHMGMKLDEEKRSDYEAFRYQIVLNAICHSFHADKPNTNSMSHNHSRSHTHISLFAFTSSNYYYYFSVIEKICRIKNYEIFREKSVVLPTRTEYSNVEYSNFLKIF